MFNTSSILRTASALTVAVLISQLLAACSGATQALPGGIAAQSRQIATSYTAPGTSAQKAAIQPPNCNGCNACPPGYQYGTWWEFYPPYTWAEFTGDYVTEVVNGVAENLTCGTWQEDVVCNSVSWSNCPPQNPWWSQFAVANWESDPETFAVSVPTSNSVQVLKATSAKAPWNVLATLSTQESTPVGVAVDHSGTIYASVLTPGASVQPNVYVYPEGATTPSSVLTDSAATGDNPAGVAVDKRRDVFWALDSGSGSAATVQIV